MSIAAPDVTVTDAQRRQLDEDGFFTTGVIVDEKTLAQVRRAFEGVWKENVAAAEKGGDAMEIDRARNRPFIAQLDRKLPVCAAFLRHPAIMDICAQLLGPDVDTTWNQTIIKAPQSGAAYDTAFSWHQDMWYATHGSYVENINPDIFYPNETALTFWVAISRTTVDNGTLWVLPGRHKEGLLNHVWDEQKREWRGEFDTSWKIPAVMRAGQALVFRKYLPHGSGANVSDEVRMAYQIGYSRPGSKTKPSIDLAPVMRGGKVVEPT